MNKDTKKVFIKNFGCQMNVRDSELVIGQFLKHGYAMSDTSEHADVILFNTCSVRQHAEEKVWSELGRLKKLKSQRSRFKVLGSGKANIYKPRTKNQEPIIGVIGCMAKNIGDKIIERMPHVDLVCSPNDLAHIYDYVKEIQKERQQVVAISSEVRDRSFYQHLHHQDKDHCYVNISEGCSNFCSYCVVPYVRGRHRSRPLQDIEKEIKQLIKDGVSLITLLGQNVNDYSWRIQRSRFKVVGSRKIDIQESGTKNQEQISFVELVELVSEIPGVKELSFVTSHPKDINVRLFDLMANKSNIKKYLHLPIQSGSNKILKAMNRKYTREEYLKIINEYRKKIPEGILATDVIVGFPGETEKDFKVTFDLIKKVKFDFVYIFKYSPRPHTAAEELEDNVPLEEKKRRHWILLEEQKKISKQIKLHEL